MRRLFVLAMLVGALIACGVPEVSILTPMATATLTATPIIAAIPTPTANVSTSEAKSTPSLAERIADLLAQVSAERLMQSVNDLSALPTRHVNSPTIGD